MTSAKDLMVKRPSAGLRYSAVTGDFKDMNKVLHAFGLKPAAKDLKKISRQQAADILMDLLWKDMAYGLEKMPQEQAASFATQIINEFGIEGSAYVSNVTAPWSTDDQSWQPLTDSTFDSGVIISNEDGYFCIWFEDED